VSRFEILDFIVQTLLKISPFTKKPVPIDRGTPVPRMYFKGTIVGGRLSMSRNAWHTVEWQQQ
jgi:hypothetical protein